MPKRNGLGVWLEKSARLREDNAELEDELAEYGETIAELREVIEGLSKAEAERVFAEIASRKVRVETQRTQRQRGRTSVGYRDGMGALLEKSARLQEENDDLQEELEERAETIEQLREVMADLNAAEADRVLAEYARRRREKAAKKVRVEPKKAGRAVDLPAYAPVARGAQVENATSDDSAVAAESETPLLPNVRPLLIVLGVLAALPPLFVGFAAILAWLFALWAG